jgi:RNA polymerase sigma-70 factor (ECF subfamily)
MAEFEGLVKTNMQRAYYSALGIIGSHDVAMELSQEAFIRAYRHFKKFDREKKFFTWYYKILRNLCFNFIRDNKNKVTSDYLEQARYASDETNPEKELEKQESQQFLEKALSELNMDDREILTLKEFEDMSYQEIADTLDIPIGTVMSRLYYARKKLAKKLQEVMA